MLPESRKNVIRVAGEVQQILGEPVTFSRAVDIMYQAWKKLEPSQREQMAREF